VSQLSARDDGPAPFLQVLIYPTTDLRHTGFESLSLFEKGFFLERSDIDWYDEQYFGGAVEQRLDPRASPALAADLRGLCPAIVVTAGFDPLFDEGNAYASALEKAGVPTRLVRFDGLIHGFVNMGSVSPSAREALRAIGGAVRDVSMAARVPSPSR
jgi:acetyl esterase